MRAWIGGWIYPFNRSRDSSSLLNHKEWNARLPEADFLFFCKKNYLFTVLYCTLRNVTSSGVYGDPLT